MNIRIVPLETWHAGIVPRLRRADVEEIRAMTGIDPKIAVAHSIANAAPGFAVLKDGRVEAIGGVGRVLRLRNEVGRPWMVGTDEAVKHPVLFYRISRRIVDVMRQCYELLENWVYDRNTLSIRWLKWAGFYVEEPEPLGVNGEMFRRFWMKGDEGNVHDAGGGRGGRGNADAGDGGEQRGPGSGTGGGTEREDSRGAGA